MHSYSAPALCSPDTSEARVGETAAKLKSALTQSNTHLFRDVARTSQVSYAHHGQLKTCQHATNMPRFMPMFVQVKTRNSFSMSWRTDRFPVGAKWQRFVHMHSHSTGFSRSTRNPVGDLMEAISCHFTHKCATRQRKLPPQRNQTRADLFINEYYFLQVFSSRCSRGPTISRSGLVERKQRKPHETRGRESGRRTFQEELSTNGNGCFHAVRIQPD